MIKLAPKTTALVLIDLQNGIVGLPLAPRTGSDVAQHSREVAGRFREAGSPVVRVSVGFALRRHCEARLRAEAIQTASAERFWIASSQGLLAMTEIAETA
jgi:nicotinamidase-related amidase